MQRAAGRAGAADPGDTTYLTVVDADGNMVSLIQSNYSEFGSGLVADGTGFALQNRGGLFKLDPHSPDALAGHKRPLHTIIPGFMTNGHERIAFGIMGGFNQAQAHAQFVSNVVDFGMNIQQAMEAPRFTKRTFRRLRRRYGRPYSRGGARYSGRPGPPDYFARRVFRHHGRRPAVERNADTGVNFGASDPRKDGEAIPQAAPTRAQP